MSAAEPNPRSNSTSAGRSALLILVAFALSRLAVWWLYAPGVGHGDETQYLRVAESLLAHGAPGYLDPGYTLEKVEGFYPYFHGHKSLPDGQYNTIFWDPLYPLLVALVHGLSRVLGGSPIEAVRAVQLLLSGATLLLGMAVVRDLFPNRPGVERSFGWLFVAYLPFAGFVTKLMAETLDAFFLTLMLWTMLRLGADRIRQSLGLGLLLGLYVSLKSYWLQLLPVLIGFAWWARAQKASLPVPAARQCLHAAALVAGVALVLAPTFVRNQNIGDLSFAISTKSSWNFWKDNNNFRIENHNWREPTLEVRRWLKPYYELGSVDAVSRLLEGVYDDPRADVRPPCDTPLPQLNACERNHALAFFFENPLRFARRALEKNLNLWSPNSYIFNRAPPGRWAWNQNLRVELPGLARYVLQLWVIGAYLFVMFAAFIGLVGPLESRSDRVARALVALCIGCLVFIVVPWGHGLTRFRLPYMVPLAMFAALGVATAREQWAEGEHRTRRLAIAGSLAVVLIAVCALRLPLLLAP